MTGPVADALFHLVHDYPGGAPALAPRMGLAASTLLSMANPNCTSHEWPLKRFTQAMVFAEDVRPLEALCVQFGGVFVPMGQFGDLAPARVLKQAARLAKEFGDVPVRLAQILADGRVSPRELADLRSEVYEMQQAAAGLVKVIEQICEQRIDVSEEDRP
jgi:hypothetical protein